MSLAKSAEVVVIWDPKSANQPTTWFTPVIPPIHPPFLSMAFSDLPKILVLP